jgi:hypothetical protein
VDKRSAIHRKRTKMQAMWAQPLSLDDALCAYLDLRFCIKTMAYLGLKSELSNVTIYNMKILHVVDGATLIHPTFGYAGF